MDRDEEKRDELNNVFNQFEDNIMVIFGFGKIPDKKSLDHFFEQARNKASSAVLDAKLDEMFGEKKSGGTQHKNGEIFREQKSVRSDYQNQFSIYFGDGSNNFFYTFYYTEFPDRIRALGNYSGSWFDHCTDDDDEVWNASEHGPKALTIAKNHLLEKFSKPVTIEPKEYFLGAARAWNQEDESSNPKPKKSEDQSGGK